MEHNQNLLEQLLNDSNQMIQVSNLDTYTMIYANKMAKDYTGHSNEPFEGRHCYEYMMGLKEQCPFCPMRQIGNLESFETEVDNGKEVYAVKTKKTKWNDSDVFIEYAWDVTEIRRSEKIYENQVQMLISSIPEAQGIFHVDLTNDKVLTVNGCSKEVLNMGNLETVDDLVSMITSYIPSSEEHEGFFNTFCRDSLLYAYANGKTEIFKETMSYFDDKSIRPAKITARLLMNPSSNHLECIIYGMDISYEWNERKKYEKQLEEQVAIFNILARNFRNVYIANINDCTARILKIATDYDFNAVKKLQNQVFPYEAIINKWIDERVHPDDKDKLRKALSVENLRKVFSVKDEYIGNYRSTEAGKLHNYQYNLGKLDDSGTVIAGFQLIDDIIEEHLAQERIQREKDESYQKELIKARQEAESANEAKTEFLQRMSHDVRTPLNGIRGMLDIAERYKDDLEKQSECREKVKEASNLLLELINEVLDMSKLESGKIVLEHEPFDILEVSKEVYTVIVRQAEEKDIEIVQYDCHIDNHKLIGSPTYFKRMLMNIMSNAIKYNKVHGKIYITCKEIENDDSIAKIEFKCKDTGIGMSKEFQKHIFEPFAQENESVRTKYNGTGLGMPITKNIVEKMGGTITFESEQDIGTTFDIVIPFEIDHSKHEEIHDDDLENYSIKDINILLAEDNELNMEIAKFLLEEEGAHVIEAWNGDEAVQKFKESDINSIDIILMDVMMPIMDGYKATKTIRDLDRKDSKNVPIVAMTANAFAEDKIKAKQEGMNGHISKPLDTKQVIKVIAKLVNGKSKDE